MKMGENGIWFGWWVGRYADGGKRCEGEFFDGLKVGPWTYYYPNGKVREQGTYETGGRQGIWEEETARSRIKPWLSPPVSMPAKRPSPSSN